MVSKVIGLNDRYEGVPPRFRGGRSVVCKWLRGVPGNGLAQNHRSGSEVSHPVWERWAIHPSAQQGVIVSAQAPLVWRIVPA